MNRVLWALLITGVALLLFVQWINAWGAPAVIIVLGAALAIALKLYNRRAVSGHQASGVDKINQPGRQITVANRTSRWWDTEREFETGLSWLKKIIPLDTVQVGSLDMARRQLNLIRQGRPVRPIDWTAPNRTGGASFAGAMTASGMTYDWCTCSEQAMPLIHDPDGSTRVNRGEETCLCTCSSCAPKGRYRDADGKWQPVQAQHWRARDMEHEVAVNLAASRRAQADAARSWSGRWAELMARIDDVKADRRDERLARMAGWEHPNVRRNRGEDVNTDTDDWYARYGPEEDETPGRHSTDRPTDPMDPRPGGHE